VERGSRAVFVGRALQISTVPVNESRGALIGALVMANKNYIPSREADLLNWSQNLYDKLTVTPADFGLTAEQVAPFATAQEAFKADYAKVLDPATKTKVTVAAKNQSKKAMLTIVRPLVQTIQNWPGMTNAKRDELEITVPDREPSSIGAPEEMPVLRIASVNGRVLDLEVRRTDGTTKRKPAGVRAVWLRTFVGAPGSDPAATPPQVLDQYEFRGESTKSNPQIVFPPDVAPGTPVWVTAQWVNPTGQPGPACAPVKAHISFQGLSEAA
jgi:hypothetical protein